MDLSKYFRYKILPIIFKFFFKREKVSETFLKGIKPKRIIMVKYHHKIGDLILGTPAFRNLKNKFPYAQIDFLAGEYNYPAVLNNCYINKIFIFKKMRGIKSIIYNIVLINRLRKIKYDLGIIFSASSFSVTNALIGFFINPSILIGLKSFRNLTDITSYLYNYEIELTEARLNETLLYLKTVEPVVGSIKYKNEEIHLSKEEKERGYFLIKDLFKSKKISFKIIGIHPGGTYIDRRWRIENYINLINRIPKNFKILIFKGRDEDELIDYLISKCDREVYKLPKELSFREICAVQSYLYIFIGNDTGTLHSAAGVGTKVIGIYTSTEPEIWAPLNKNFVALKNPSVKEVLNYISLF